MIAQRIIVPLVLLAAAGSGGQAAFAGKVLPENAGPDSPPSAVCRSEAEAGIIDLTPTTTLLGRIRLAVAASADAGNGVAARGQASATGVPQAVTVPDQRLTETQLNARIARYSPDRSARAGKTMRDKLAFAAATAAPAQVHRTAPN